MTEQESGGTRGHFERRFTSPLLAGHAWPLVRIDSGRPGPRLCVMAGMHVNEVSSMEAVLRLADTLEGNLLRGMVEIMPVVNVPALWQRVEQLCPVDGQNINFSFPGDPRSGFSAALADALLREWADDAELLIDLHGGDMQTQVAHFVMCQMTGNPAFDAITARFARCFDADAIVEFVAGQRENAGRACNARPQLGRHAVMAEGGGNGLIREEDVVFHLEGTLNCARLLRIYGGEPPVPRRAQQALVGVERLSVPADGRFYPLAEIMKEVEAGEEVGRLLDVYGREITRLRAPCAGPLVFRYSHPLVAAGEVVIGIGRRASEAAGPIEAARI